MRTHHLFRLVAFCLAGLLFAFSGPTSGRVVKPLKPAWIDAFSGWASPTTGQLFARVHHGTPPLKPVPGQSDYKRFRQTVEGLELDAIPRATVSVQGIPGVTSAVADKHGFVMLKLPAGLRPGVLDVTLNVTTEGWTSPPATLEVEVFDDSAGLGVISDIDDTLVDSGVTDKPELIRNTLFHSKWEIKTFPLAPETVSALAGKGADGLPKVPLFYLSGSPWGLHSRISELFDRVGFPHGVMILRRYSQEPVRDPAAFKYPHLKDLFEAFPHKTWILLGDSGEKDPEVYAKMRGEYPGRERAEYIHLVTAENPHGKRFANAKVFRVWSEVEQDAAAQHIDVGR
jgi:phosphatidate phosphatase APP1